MTTKKECTDWGTKLKNTIEDFYNPRILATKDLIEKAINEKRNPNAVEIEGGIATINYVRLLEQTEAAKGAAASNVNTQVNTCNDSALPDWLTDAQKATDYALAITALPYVELTRQYAAAKVDLGKIYNGYPLGGDGALIPKFRDEILNGLGIGGNEAEWLRDPVNKMTDAVKIGVQNINIPPINYPKIEFPKIEPVPMPKVDVPTGDEVVEGAKKAIEDIGDRLGL